MKKVLVFGTFDLLHNGHIDFLKQAKQFGEHLTVVVGRDQTVKKIKGSYPKDNEQARKEKLSKVSVVDEVILGHLNKDVAIVAEINPDVICLGYDQKNILEKKLWEFICDSHKLISVFRLKPFNPKRFKTSLIKEKQLIESP